MKLSIKIKSADIMNVFLVVVGTAVLSLGVSLFLIPFELVAGGCAGLAIIVAHVIPGGAVSADVALSVISWALFVVGAVTLGKAFAVKTLLSALLYPFFVTLFSRLLSPDFLNGYFIISEEKYGAVAIILGCLIGGGLVGCGVALTFRGGGSTGGTDVIALLLAKKIKTLKSSTSVFLTDALVVLLGIVVIGDLVKSLLGILCAFISAAAVDKITLVGNRAMTAEIVTERAEEINRAVREKLNRTATVINATGGYTGRNIYVVRITFTRGEYAALKKVIAEIAPRAFITVYSVSEVNGKGWRKNGI